MLPSWVAKTVAGDGTIPLLRRDRECAEPLQLKRGVSSHPFRQYVVRPCSPSFGIHSKFSRLPQNAVLIRSLVFSLIGLMTVVSDREFGGRFAARAPGLGPAHKLAWGWRSAE